MESNPSFRNKLVEHREARTLPACYWEHTVVQAAAPETVAPLALYLDGVPYSQTDSVIGWWVECLVTGARFLWAVTRKRTACKCGCKGWCTFHAFFRLFHWSATALAQKRWPLRRHDGQDWQAADHDRAAKAGSDMRMQACFLHIKGLVGILYGVGVPPLE